MRLNFSYSEDEVIKEGIKRLADVIKEEMEGTFDEEDHFADGI
jgi:DNA-binding transcriptional MocR family regulator